MSRLAAGLLGLILLLVLIKEGSRLPEFIGEVGLAVMARNTMAPASPFRR